jgi:hypothetical protein
MYKVFSFGKMTYGSNTSNSLAAKQILVGMVPELYLKKHNFFLLIFMRVLCLKQGIKKVDGDNIFVTL